MNKRQDDIMAKFKAKKGLTTQPADSPTTDDEISAAMAAAASTVDEPKEDTPPPRRQAPAKTKTAKPRSDLEIPPPVPRIGDATERTTIMVPAELDPLKDQAKRYRMTPQHLILAAAAAHGPSLLEDANAGIILPMPTAGSKPWQVRMSLEEIKVLDDLVADTRQGFVSPSRSAIVTELLRRCTQTTD